MVVPVLLYGFDFATQQRQRFGPPWGAAFLTPKFTDESHPALKVVMRDVDKKREVKYGNNIAVLFGAMIECRRYFDHPEFWNAIARGFNTKQEIVRVTANILTEARIVHRKPDQQTSGWTSDTVRAADAWIEYLDKQWQPTLAIFRPTDGADLRRIADSFFAKMPGKMVNAANIPDHDGRPIRIEASTYRPAAVGEANGGRGLGVPALPPPGAAVTEPAVTSRLVRKRSASPVISSDIPEAKRVQHDHPSEQSRSREELQQQEPQQKPQEIQQGFTQKQQQQSQPQHEPDKASEAGSLQPSNPIQKAQQAQSLPSDEKSIDQDAETAGPPVGKPVEELTDGALRNRVGRMAKRLAVMETKPENADAVTREIKSDMKTLKDELSVIKSGISDVVESLHLFADQSRLLGEEMAGLRRQHDAAATTAATAAAATAASPQPLERETEEQKKLIDSLTQEVAQLKARIAATAAAPKQPPPPPPPPTNLRQAMAAAEEDMKRHLATVERFSERLDGSRNRAATETVADLLLTLHEGVRIAQTGQRL
ncbi:hypothetical protein QBC46DRAFT_386418 [Diplogelasinospora grovesii]|uniref:Uncharacterized protein n=1 Tax=Diplogelasinospora grovesii TaxID=303347 RepID=A0AAN6N7G1_9PEZI|nr:hypothetical protein QBC46DRAFT_386418 [Diplogelasinospora grovesii]